MGLKQAGVMRRGRGRSEIFPDDPKSLNRIVTGWRVPLCGNGRTPARTGAPGPPPSTTGARAGWTGKPRRLETQLWLGATYWDTFATATGTVSDPDGGSLRFEVDQGPRWPWTYSVGGHVSFNPRIEAAIDLGTDFHGGWSLALIPGFRF